MRLNEFVRQQTKWSAAEMENRGRILAHRALEIWPHHNADESLVAAEEVRELRRRAASRKPGSMSMDDSVAEVLYAIRDAIRELGESIEIIEGKSLCFYNAQSADFFAETLPMASYVRVLLPIDFEEIDDLKGMVGDVTAWKFLPNVTHTATAACLLTLGASSRFPRQLQWFAKHSTWYRSSPPSSRTYIPRTGTKAEYRA